MIIDPVWERWFALQWRAATERLRNADVDWKKWKIVPEHEGSRNVYK